MADTNRYKVKNIMNTMSPSDVDMIKVGKDTRIKEAWKKINDSHHNEMLVVDDKGIPVKVLRVNDIAKVSSDKVIADIFSNLDDVLKVSQDKYIDEFSEEEVKKFMVVDDGSTTRQIVGTLKPSDIISRLSGA